MKIGENKLLKINAFDLLDTQSLEKYLSFIILKFIKYKKLVKKDNQSIEKERGCTKESSSSPFAKYTEYYDRTYKETVKKAYDEDELKNWGAKEVYID